MPSATGTSCLNKGDGFGLRGAATLDVALVPIHTSHIYPTNHTNHSNHISTTNHFIPNRHFRTVGTRITNHPITVY